MSERDIYARRKKNETVEGHTTNVTTASDVARWAVADKSPSGKGSPPKPNKKSTSSEVREKEIEDEPL